MNYFYINSTDLFPNVDPQNNFEKVIQFPLTRLVIAVVFVFSVIIINSVVTAGINHTFDASASIYLNYLTSVLFVAAALAVYAVYTNVVENRKAYELSFQKSLQELGAGSVLGAATIIIIVTILAVLGFYEIEEINSFGNVVFMFFDQMKTGFIEELLFRVILFKITEELFGTWTAMAIQGILFGFAHSGNPNATFYSTLALIISFTIFFGGGYMITRRIWFIAGFHWSWNFFQAGIFGMQNSGIDMPSLIEPNVTGPEWLTGGDWGLELSVLSIMILFSISLYFLKLAKQREQFVKPMWRR